MNTSNGAIVAPEQEDWDDEDEGEYDEDEDGDEDIDAEAQEIARRLGEELWADISKAQAAIAPAATPITSTTHPSLPQSIPPTANSSRKEDAVITTMMGILELIVNDPLAQSTLASAIIPDSNGDNVLAVMQRAVAVKSIPKANAMPLSHILVSLARSDTLFGKLRHSNASAIELDRGKRKREEDDAGQDPHGSRMFKRPYMPDSSLHAQVIESVHLITQALGSATSQPLDPALVASIRLQLHQVFLFAVTSSAGGGHEMHALQEISGLIQVIGVLSGIQIGQTPASINHHGQVSQSYTTNPAYPWLVGHSPPGTDIGTAVYPCLVAGCRRTFSRLYSLRAHQRGHSVHRPYRCTSCPASFARNHDLKRHVKLHDRKAWKCAGCQKDFSRLDAIKRHKNGNKHRGPRSEVCLNAAIVEVQLDEGEGEESIREERRAKLWNGIATNQANNGTTPHPYGEDPSTEEGEIQPAVISSIQGAVMSLHGLLQAHVGNALGAPVGQPTPIITDPASGQATLASVIARAQLQNLPQKSLLPTPAGQDNGAMANAVVPIESAFLAEGSSLDNAPINQNSSDKADSSTLPSLSMYGLSDEQTKMLELAIASAASAAQAQAEAEAALEEQEEEDFDPDDEDYDGSDGQPNMNVAVLLP